MTTATQVSHPVRIGLIGAGGITRPHVQGHVAAPDAVITAIADLDAANAAQRAAEAGTNPRVYSDFRDLVSDSEVDAVDICLPHHLHAAAILAAAEQGKHVLCEKPLCLTIAEGEQIRDAVAASGITLMCSHNQLYFPAVQRAREVLEAGGIGDVYEIRTTDSFFNDFDPATAGWRGERAKIGGGELIDTGYHPTYLMRYLAGEVPTEVTAMISRHRLRFMEGEDSAQVLIRFAGGKVGHIVTSWAYDAAGCTERFSAVGPDGALWSDGTTLHVRRRGEDVQTETFQTVDTIPAVVADFSRRLTAGARPIHNQDEGIDVLRVILGAYASAEQGRTVTLADL